ncbi:hypothetical protein KCP76_14010 [Salmonella enterica subsp. enterica serovar Weltevreden]|nr:hypothetical protein KCP76_14010 [Salmonella enterica subsp. enterica serovar Weltevreden]
MNVLTFLLVKSTISRSRTGDDNGKWNDDKTGSLVWAGGTYWRISERWGETRVAGAVRRNTG